jgi:lipopolysaccharide transport system permease protein
LLLAAFTFVFGTVFRPAGAGDREPGELRWCFPGIPLHALLAESFNRAPGLVVAVPNYVKKVVFPLDLCRWWR